MDLTLNRAVLGLQLSGIRRFTFLVRVSADPSIFAFFIS